MRIEGDETSCAITNAYFESNGIVEVCATINNDHPKEIKLYDDCGAFIKDLKKPVRFGEILDALEKTKQSLKSKAPSPKITFHKTKLDTTIGLFTKENGEEIDLTEKEVEILTVLHAEKGAVISRQNLLKRIWNYVEDIETHTLETHIYRLRQKIEEQPAEPKILITDDNGYRVMTEG